MTHHFSLFFKNPDITTYPAVNCEFSLLLRDDTIEELIVVDGIRNGNRSGLDF